MSHGRLLLTLVMILGLTTSCFTGVESTPLIKAPTSDKHSRQTPEETIFNAVKGIPPRLWATGKPFFIVDEAIDRVVAAAEAPSKLRKGDTLLFESAEAVASIVGRKEMKLTFRDRHGNAYSYRPQVAEDEWAGKETLAIPFAIELSMVEQVGALLEGRRLWTRTRRWRDADDTPTDGRLFVEVSVTEVAPGTELNPIRLKIVDNRGREGYIFLNPRVDANSPRTFASQLSLSDPWQAYPDIDKPTRTLITEGITAEGMTMTEVKLALGAPLSIRRSTFAGLATEQWTYDNGRIVEFENGRMIKR